MEGTEQRRWSDLGAKLLAIRVPQARDYLVPIARRRELATYGQVMKAIGTGRAYIGQILDELNKYEHAAGRPMISSIVVLEDDGPTVPSDGFYMLARELKPACRSMPNLTIFESERDVTWSFA